VRNNSESTARGAMFSSMAAVSAVVYPDSDIVQIFTTNCDDDLVVARSSAVEPIAPWATGTVKTEVGTQAFGCDSIPYVLMWPARAC
jgi:hypothetical protein